MSESDTPRTDAWCHANHQRATYRDIDALARQLERELAEARKGPPDIWPCTIINDRYGGAYSDANWTAWNKYEEDIPGEISGGDCECSSFWNDYEGIVGKGESPNAAVEDLWRRIHETTSSAATI